MIEKSVVERLLDVPDLETALGGPKVYFQRAPTEAVLPWLVVKTLPHGRVDRLTQVLTEEKNTLRIEIEDSQPVRARTIAEIAFRALHNFRGDMSDSSDVVLRCSSIWGEDGYSGTYKSVFDVTAKAVETTTYPNGSGS